MTTKEFILKPKKNKEIIERWKCLCDYLPTSQGEKLRFIAISSWADEPPEIFWKNLVQFVKNHVDPDSKNQMSIHTYAILYGLTDESMRRYFKTHGV